ncbi:hypothetical protein JVU11DRAFT_5332 [Chiua virens]|nr:hypothetical protein JVU11DRAFT_5332 [Chiua virens]
MLFISSVIPAIYITPASPQRTDLNPYSPILSAKLDKKNDAYRAKRLSLPPLVGTSPWYSPSLRSAKCSPNNGLSRDEFKLLLEVSRDRRAKREAQKVSSDLGKESAFKRRMCFCWCYGGVVYNKTPIVERTARFLAKVGNLPLCTATAAVSEVHNPSSSGGLVFESAALDVTEDNPGDVIPVNPFHHAGQDGQGGQGPFIAQLPLTSSDLSPASPKKGRCVPPSLDEIIVRLRPAPPSSEQVDRRQSRLPNFLKASNTSSGCTGNQSQAITVRSVALNDEKVDITFGQQVVYPPYLDTFTLKLGTRHTIIPHAAHIMTAPTLSANRADTTRNLIMTLRRRSSPRLGHHKYTQTSTEAERCSSPAKLRHGGWVGFHNVPLSFHGL